MLYHASYFSLILIFVIACQSTEQQTDSQLATSSKVADATVPEVRTVVARQGVFTLHLLSNGKVSALAQSQLQFRAAGMVEKVLVSNGSTVKAGQLLASLYHQNEQLAIENARQQIAEAEVEINDLLIQLRGKENDSTSVPPKVWAYIKLRSGYSKAQLALRQVQIQLENTYLRAPYAGTIANLRTQAYNPTPTSEPFCTLLSRASMQVQFPILETELSVLQIGQRVRVSPVALPQKSYIGTVSEINPVVSEQGLVQVKARIQQSDNQLFEGMNMQIVVEKVLPNQLIIPKEAVVERSGRKVVFTEEGGFAKWHYVSILHENATEVTVTEGLSAGEKVIVEGNLNLGHDAQVKAKKQAN